MAWYPCVDTALRALKVAPFRGWLCLLARHIPALPLQPFLPFVLIDLSRLPGPSRSIVEMEGREKKKRGREEKGGNKNVSMVPLKVNTQNN